MTGIETIRTIAVIGSDTQDPHVKVLAQVLDMLARRGHHLVVEREFAAYLRRHGAFPEGMVETVARLDEARLPDFAVSFGGDGTLLRAAAWIKALPVPILGINTGHLGYLTAVNIDCAQPLLAAVIAGDYMIERRSLIEVDSPLLDPGRIWPFALNEVAVLKDDTASMLEVDTMLGSDRLAAYHADGLLVATPTGSTAYNLSVGGPILEPMAPNWVLTPIAAHTLTMRPLVLSDASVLSLTTTSRAAGYRISIDGRSAMLPTGSTVTLKRAPFSIGVIQSRSHSFAATLRNKLHWGN